MSGIFSRGSTVAGADQETRKNAVMDEIRNQMALQNAQELINNMNEKCYAKCITKPSTELSSSEQGCLTKCMDRYLEAFNVVSQSYVTRVSKERQAASVPLPGEKGQMPELS